MKGALKQRLDKGKIFLFSQFLTKEAIELCTAFCTNGKITHLQHQNWIDNKTHVNKQKVIKSTLKKRNTKE